MTNNYCPETLGRKVYDDHGHYAGRITCPECGWVCEDRAYHGSRNLPDHIRADAIGDAAAHSVLASQEYLPYLVAAVDNGSAPTVPLTRLTPADVVAAADVPGVLRCHERATLAQWVMPEVCAPIA